MQVKMCTSKRNRKHLKYIFVTNTYVQKITEDSFPLEAECMAVDTGIGKPLAANIIYLLNQRKTIPCSGDFEFEH